ncbi:MAG: LCP family protein [Clostridia bacterium]|nr:LCP family protein [Clostridia bacterium]
MQRSPVIDDVPQEKIQVSPVGVLCILREDETAFYTVVTVDPTARTVTALPLTDNEIDEIYRKDGAAVLRDRLQEKGEQVDFYVDVTFEQMREWLQYLGNGVGVTLQENITYTDTAGLVVSFPAGTLTLSANQTADMLRAVEPLPTAAQTVANVWAGIVRRYTTQDRNFTADYTALTDIGETDIHIYDFQKALPHLEKMTEEK